MTEPLSGFAFPFRIAGGRVARAEGPEKVEHNLRHLLSTRLGERLMLRGYGGGVHHHLQEPNDTTRGAVIKHEIERALRTFMPEVRLTAPIRLTAREGELTVVVEYAANPRDAARRLELRLP